MENPTCPATILRPQLDDLYTDKPTKRSLEVESSKFETLRKRASRYCSIDNWVRLVQYATIMLSVNRAEMDPFRTTWDDLFAGHYDVGVHYDSLYSHLQSHPLIDPHGLVENVLYDPLDAGPGLRRERDVGAVLCEVPTRRNRAARGINKALDIITSHNINITLNARKIEAWGESFY